MKCLKFLIFILALQNVNAEDTIFFDKSPSRKFLVLWLGQIKEDNNKFQLQLQPHYYIQIDSVLNKVGHVNEILNVDNKWKAFTYTVRCPHVKAYTDYVALSRGEALNFRHKILVGNCEDILPDTPENRRKLIKKFKETTVIYEKGYLPYSSDKLSYP